jgi:hypothetical protein
MVHDRSFAPQQHAHAAITEPTPFVGFLESWKKITLK